MLEDQNHAGFKSLKKSPALMEKLCNFNAESTVSKWLRVDNSVTVEHFYSSTTVTFINALIVKMKGIFSLDNPPVLRAMTCLNPDKIPKENDKKFFDYGKNNNSMLHDFYGNQRDDIFEGRRLTSFPILACTTDLLAAEYNGYKTYVARQTIKQYQIYKKEERNLEARLLQASANR